MPKFCPWGFYSFYVSKEMAQAGGCHHCLESKCGLWETFYDDEGNVTGQCSILGMGESLRSVSESLAEIAEGRTSFPIETISSEIIEAVKPVRKLDSFLDKLRTKKLAEAQKQADNMVAEASKSPGTELPMATPAVTGNTGNTGIQGDSQQAKLSLDDLDALLNPPPLPVTQLPVVSKNPSPVGGVNGEGA